MDDDRPLIEKDPRLVANQNPGSGTAASGKRGRPGLIPLIVVLALAGVAAAGWGIHRAMASRGTIRITTKPAGAMIDIDGMTVYSRYPEGAVWLGDHEEITWSQPETLRRKPGTYDLTVTADGYRSRAVQAVVEAGQTTTFDVELQLITDIRLEIASRPTGRHVILDHQQLMKEPDHLAPAETDLGVYAISDGSHSIEIPGDCRYLPWKQQVVLQPGAITRVEATLEVRPFKPKWCSEEEWRRK